MPRRGRLVRALLVVAVAVLASRSAHAGDPYLRWSTLRTPYFRVHYHGGLEEVAQRTATMAEAINARLMPVLGWKPSEVTHIRLADTTDGANGSAAGLPFNTISLFITAPDDMSPLGDYEDWMLELLTHEHTHILHVDQVTGVPALVNAIVGKTMVPNQVQPRWILEGLAVVMESDHTSGGRLRSTLFDMYLRADVLEDNFASIDQVTHSVRRWPESNIWYLYGGRFLAWIASIYGPDVFNAISADYGNNAIPWGINRSLRRATGSTYPELYRAWHEHLRRHYGAVAQAVKRRGLRNGVRLTHHGRVASYPRFVPDCARSGPREELLYHRDDGHSLEGLYRLPLATRSRALEDDSELAIRTAGGRRMPSFGPDCGVVFTSTLMSRRLHRFDDLHYEQVGPSSNGRVRRSREHWTVGLRARDPAVSPDERRLVFVTNHLGTSTLRIADIVASGGIERVRALVPSARNEQAFTPRFSADGHHVAYSVWTEGGYRDIRVVDVRTGRFRQLTRDRAYDYQPTFSPDGRIVYFASDRTGIANIYAHELATGRLWQVTNVLGGAYMPEVTPDGRTLFYVGYNRDGFDLYSMPLEKSRWLDAPPAPVDRPAPLPSPRPRRWPVESYNPLPTLRPRAIDLTYGTATFGEALTACVSGSDIVGFHGVSGCGTVQTELDRPTWSADYGYHRLPFTFRVGAFQTVVPRRVQVGGSPQDTREVLTGVTTGISYTVHGEFDSQNFGLSYTISERDTDVPVGTRLDPFTPISREPFQGFLASVHAGWHYDNVTNSAYAVSPEQGISLSISGDFAGPETASEATLAAVDARAVGYVVMPWHRHHVVALGVGAGAAGGTFPDRGFFFTGGFVDIDPVESFRSGIRQSGFVLRGYPPGRFVGRQYNLNNVEYRFPIWHAERGVSTLPIFVQTFSGTVFADYGGAFDGIDPEDPLAVYHLGIGAELRVDLIFGYFVGGNVRFGVARGFDEFAVPGLQKYLVLASGF